MGQPVLPVLVRGEARELQAALVVQQEHGELLGRVPHREGVDNVQQEVGLPLPHGAANEEVGVRGVLGAQGEHQRLAPDPPDHRLQAVARGARPGTLHVVANELHQGDPGSGDAAAALHGLADDVLDGIQGGGAVVGDADGSRQAGDLPAAVLGAQGQPGARRHLRGAVGGVGLDHQVQARCRAHGGHLLQDPAQLVVHAVGVVQEHHDGQDAAGLALPAPQVQQVPGTGHGNALGVLRGGLQGLAQGGDQGPGIGHGGREGRPGGGPQRAEGPDDAGDAGVEDEDTQVLEGDLPDDAGQGGEHQLLGLAGGAGEVPVAAAQEGGQGRHLLRDRVTHGPVPGRAGRDGRAGRAGRDGRARRSGRGVLGDPGRTHPQEPGRVGLRAVVGLRPGDLQGAARHTGGQLGDQGAQGGARGLPLGLRRLVGLGAARSPLALNALLEGGGLGVQALQVPDAQVGGGVVHDLGTAQDVLGARLGVLAHLGQAGGAERGRRLRRGLHGARRCRARGTGGRGGSPLGQGRVGDRHPGDNDTALGGSRAHKGPWG